MINKNKLIIASAGAGKTTHLIKSALECQGNVAILTYTTKGQRDITNRIIKLNGFVPNHIKVMGWIEFQLNELACPYQLAMGIGRIKGYINNNERSTRYKKRGERGYYYDKKNRIYSDKIGDFICQCNTKTNGAVFKRTGRVYDNIYIDELQDFQGYDYELFMHLLNSESSIIAVCDPRQQTLSTNPSGKHKKFRDNLYGELYKLSEKGYYTLDEVTLSRSFRCHESILCYIDKIYPRFNKTVPHQKDEVEHVGIYLVHERHIADYIEEHQPTLLRYNKKCKFMNCEHLEKRNIGSVKGLTYDRVLLKLASTQVKQLATPTGLAPESKSNLYVGISRARYSVGIIVPNDFDTQIENINYYREVFKQPTLFDLLKV